MPPLRGGICMGVDLKNHVFAPELSSRWWGERTRRRRREEPPIPRMSTVLCEHGKGRDFRRTTHTHTHTHTHKHAHTHTRTHTYTHTHTNTHTNTHTDPAFSANTEILRSLQTRNAGPAFFANTERDVTLLDKGRDSLRTRERGFHRSLRTWKLTRLSENKGRGSDH